MFENAEALAEAVCEVVEMSAFESIKARGAFTLVVPGGSVAKMLKGLTMPLAPGDAKMAKEQNIVTSKDIDWTKVHVFFANERVPARKNEKLARETEELPLYFHLLRTWYRDVLMVQTGMGPEVLVHRDLFEQARARAATVSPRAVMARLERVNDVESALARQANPRLSLETLLLGLVGVDRGL